MSLETRINALAQAIGVDLGVLTEEVALLNLCVTGIEYQSGIGIPAIARQIVASSSSTNTALTPSCRKISIRARYCDIRFSIGDSAQVASATESHFIAQGERLITAAPEWAHIAVIRDNDAQSNGVLEMTELM